MQPPGLKFTSFRGRRRCDGQHPYGIVAEYDNPTDRTVKLGGMAHLSEIFAPETLEGWSALNVGSSANLRDAGALPAPLPGAKAQPGMEGSDTGRHGSGPPEVEESAPLPTAARERERL